MWRPSPAHRPSDERSPVMYGHFCLIPRVSVHGRYYCIYLQNIVILLLLLLPLLLLLIASPRNYITAIESINQQRTSIVKIPNKLGNMHHENITHKGRKRGKYYSDDKTLIKKCYRLYNYKRATQVLPPVWKDGLTVRPSGIGLYRRVELAPACARI